MLYEKYNALPRWKGAKPRWPLLTNPWVGDEIVSVHTSL